MQPVPLVETTRGYPATGQVVENVHMGSVAVVDRAGKLVWWAGDPQFPTFTRSALKPFQALPFVLAGGPARFGLTGPELALLCASHSGEARHLETVASILGKIGLGEDALECGCHAPLYYDSVGRPAPQDRVWTQLHHNCSGKHSGFLAWCRLHDLPTRHYVDPAHPLQQSVRAQLAGLLGCAPEAMPVGMDGCSAPNYALPLSRLAHLYARLAHGPSDPQHGAAMGDLRAAMTGHPELVSGEARCDLAYMSAGAGDWVSKVGADAVQAIGIGSAGLGIAIKVADGNTRALQCVTVSVLEQLGLLDADRRAQLAHYREPALSNVRGAVVGAIRPVFALRHAR
ncbi:asparaginase [Massilia glaciei]|uniref:Asparaginase n=1 Tax=Massilia glaciei TaxID=1524097 RepID=A0A2U2I5C6_9BURK|nr:asparaginase [Massilia glaciei]PWF54825.1 asparaginase [Massilia glaciei]